MTNKRIAILDASHSLFQSSSHPLPESDTKPFDLLPIPDFRALVVDAVRAALPPGSVNKGRVAVIDVGVVCEGCTVGGVLRALHVRVLRKLKG